MIKPEISRKKDRLSLSDRSNISDLPKVNPAPFPDSRYQNIQALLSRTPSRTQTDPFDEYINTAKNELVPRLANVIELLLRHVKNDPIVRQKALECIKCYDPEKVILDLFELQLEHLRGRFSKKNSKTIGIFLPSQAYREHPGNLAQRLREKGFNVIVLVGESYQDKYENEPDVYYGGTNIIKDMDFLDAVISVTLTDGLPEKAKKILMVHDIHDTPVGDEDEFFRLLKLFDYACLSSQPVVNMFHNIVSPRQSTLKPGHALNLIPSGYIKLDRTLAYCQKHQEDQPVIVYAPTIIDIGFDDLVSIPAHGLLIVEKILNDFPEHVLVFRPHPHTLSKEPVQRIVEQFKENPCFVLDSSGSDYMDLYSKAALMVTDMSGTAYTYALSTLRPVVFFSPDEAAVAEKYKGSHYFIDREKIGAVARNTEEMSSHIRNFIANPDICQQKANAYRDQFIFNVGRAEDYLVENFELILEGKAHPSWNTYRNEK